MINLISLPYCLKIVEKCELKDNSQYFMLSEIEYSYGSFRRAESRICMICLSRSFLLLLYWSINYIEARVRNGTAKAWCRSLYIFTGSLDSSLACIRQKTTSLRKNYWVYSVFFLFREFDAQLQFNFLGFSYLKERERKGGESHVTSSHPELKDWEKEGASQIDQFFNFSSWQFGFCMWSP